MKKKTLIILGILTILINCFLPGIAANPTCSEFSIAAGVVPHHLVAKAIIEDFFNYISGKDPHTDTIILISPDHWNSALLDREKSFITVPWEQENTKIGDIPIDFVLLKELASSNPLKQALGAVQLDFGITNLLPFIRKYFSNAKIIPLLMPGDMDREETAKLVESIHELASLSTVIIVSVDFSHYLPSEAAYFHDIKSMRVLLNFEEENFGNIEVDCWQCLYAARYFAKLRGKENPLILNHQNSIQFIPGDSEKTTSYVSVAFCDEKIDKPGVSDQIGSNDSSHVRTHVPETILLAGDIMLDRGIAKLIIQNSAYYPFQRINQFLRGNDIVFANLEGVLLENPPELPEHSLKFSFPEKVLEGIRQSQINLLSLANNHTTDFGKEGFKETAKCLEQSRIHFIGNPLSTDYENAIPNSFSTKQVIFLAFNRVLPFIQPWDEMLIRIMEAKRNHPDKFLIVSMHWGKEFQITSSPLQRELAHQIIAAGADLIVGHHPHVVQEIEIFQGKLIFYSLGNFVFDSQFLPETRRGLTLGLSVQPDKVTCRLFPIQINNGQPTLSNQSEAKEFLKNLARRSDKRLRDMTEKGIIEITEPMNSVSANHEEE